jgi:hypothetical protein
MEMTMFRPMMILAASAALAGCAQTPAQTARAAAAAAADQAELGRQLKGLVAVGERSCLPTLPSTMQVEAYGPTLLYTAGAGQKYRSDTTGGCESIARGDILVTVSNSGSTCRGDISRTVDRTGRFPTGSCSLGSFVEYRKP